MSEYEKTCLIRGDGGRAIRGILDRIGDKSTLLVVATLHGQRMRFTELGQRIPGISQRMLTLTLGHLERDGMVVAPFSPKYHPGSSTSSPPWAAP